MRTPLGRRRQTKVPLPKAPTDARGRATASTNRFPSALFRHLLDRVLCDLRLSMSLRDGSSYPRLRVAAAFFAIFERRPGP